MMLNQTTFELTAIAETRYLRIAGAVPVGFHGEQHDESWWCPLDAHNAAALRKHLPWTAPMPAGQRKSIGCGDRLGLATAGHLRAVQKGDLFPVLAQQSIREMQRSQRTAQQVLDDVTWAVLAADYRGGYGSDADHLKTTQAIDECLAAGFTGFTLDPGEFVDDSAVSADENSLRTKFAALPWQVLETTPDAVLQQVQTHWVGGKITAAELMRAACKYGAALAHVVHLARHLAGYQEATYDLEISLDETATPTTLLEHEYIVRELRRLQIPFTGLAPRFVGQFEKGVDYIGDLALFEQSFAQHAALARAWGSYKLSIHSGSDKFSLYPIIARHANPHVHLKTAGTSWLEALRVIAQVDPHFMRTILDYAVERYPTDRASYHVSAEIDQIPALPDAQLGQWLDHFHARQVLHVTFGSLLAQFRAPIYTILREQAALYANMLEMHFLRHIDPFHE